MNELLTSNLGFLSLGVFLLAYVFVILEDIVHLKKSIPVMLSGGLIWLFAAIASNKMGLDIHALEHRANHSFLEATKLIFFLIVAMTYVNTMEERGVFEKVKSKLESKGLSLRKIFWITGSITFCLSPIADNLTSALVLMAVCIAVAGNSPKFIGLSGVNIVIAANAGGVFSPFGDITSLMVWQAGKVQFGEFVYLIAPALVNWIIPAFIMSFGVSNSKTEKKIDMYNMKSGAKTIVFLFIGTIATAVTFHNVLHLPPVLGMMLGFAVLKLFGFFITKNEKKNFKKVEVPEEYKDLLKPTKKPFDSFVGVKRAGWDELFFFYGIIMTVEGLAFFGYLAYASDYLYGDLGATSANIALGGLSALIDNIPVMQAILSMNPTMGLDQWLLITLTTGTGGSLLSIGSAAGVALMSTSRHYNFKSHLKWAPVIFIGYITSVGVTILVTRLIL